MMAAQPKNSHEPSHRNYEHSIEHDDNKNSEPLALRARKCWIESTTDLADVERQYREIYTRTNDSSNAHVHQMVGEKLALLLIQSNRTKEADSILHELGYTARLAECILNYPLEEASTVDVKLVNIKKAPCCILDNFLTSSELSLLRSVFADANAPYWTEHNYSVEPAPSPYVSYLIPLSDLATYGALGQLISRVQTSLQNEWFSKYSTEDDSLFDATYCEMWAHHRPHCSGHQFHFDSDNEGNCTKGKRPKHPWATAILYLNATVGGPSVITNQRLNTKAAHAPTAWMAHATTGRLVALDGKVLHGVVPGKGVAPVQNGRNVEVDAGSSSRHRVTLMLAFWRRIQVRSTGSAARLFRKDSIWGKQLTSTTIDLSACSSHATIVPATAKRNPIVLDRVYECVGTGKTWTPDMGFLEYDQIFQGF